MSTEPEPPPRERDRGGPPLAALLVAGAIMCLGSIGAGGYFLWFAAQNARVRTAEGEFAIQEQRRQAKAESEAQLQQVATALATGLKSGEPAADTYTKDGKPLLSWRVHLLPRLGHAELYAKFKLDEPWDGPNNGKLVGEIPGAFASPGPHKNWLRGLTYTCGFRHEGAVFEKRAHVTPGSITAGSESTLAIFDAGEPVVWTQPDELEWKPNQPRPGFGGADPDRDNFLAATASGEVYWIRRSLPDATLRALFDRRREARPDLQLTPEMHD
jgi:hypothetical protein